jgi:hypothetical protein
MVSINCFIERAKRSKAFLVLVHAAVGVILGIGIAWDAEADKREHAKAVSREMSASQPSRPAITITGVVTDPNGKMRVYTLGN